MAMTTNEAIEAMLGDESVSLVRPEVGALEAITRSEVAMQLDSAHRYPRSTTKFLREALALATFSVEVAESCMYSIPRDGKMITGPSVRLAEMCATAWGNLHVGARVIEIGEREVTAQAVGWDLEKNVRVTVEAQRSIMTKTNRRFGDDMIRVTGMAAISIALRNAIFRVIPRTYVDAVYQKALAVAVGDAKTLVARRDEAFERLAKLGAPQERVLSRLAIAGPSDITLEHLEILIGLGTAIKSGELSLDEAFPVLAPVPVPEGTPEGKRVRMGASKKTEPKTDAAPAPQKTEPKPAPKAEAKPTPPTKPAHAKPANDVPISGPPGKPATLNWPVVHAALAIADKGWAGEDRLVTIMEWEPEQLRSAFEWARAMADTTIEDDRIPPRPEHTKLDRQPGED